MGESITSIALPSFALNFEAKSFAANVELLYSIPTIPTADIFISLALASVIFIFVCSNCFTLCSVIQNSFTLSKNVLPFNTVSKWSSGGASPITISCKTISSLHKKRSSFFSAGVNASSMASLVFEGNSRVRISSFCFVVGMIPRVISFLYAICITSLISFAHPVTRRCKIFFGSTASSSLKGTYSIFEGHISMTLFLSINSFSSFEYT